jgi:hypothetical protein
MRLNIVTSSSCHEEGRPRLQRRRTEITEVRLQLLDKRSSLFTPQRLAHGRARVCNVLKVMKAKLNKHPQRTEKGRCVEGIESTTISRRFNTLNR